MNPFTFHDRQASRLLRRVRDDLSRLRLDVASLLSHTAHRTVPHGARQLADAAKERIGSSGNYAASKLKAMRPASPQDTAAIAGGILAIGLISFGVYALCKSKCCHRNNCDQESNDDFEEV